MLFWVRFAFVAAFIVMVAAGLGHLGRGGKAVSVFAAWVLAISGVILLLCGLVLGTGDTVAGPLGAYAVWMHKRERAGLG